MNKLEEIEKEYKELALKLGDAILLTEKLKLKMFQLDQEHAKLKQESEKKNEN